MSTEKIYKSLTKGEVGVYQGTHVDDDGAIKCTLLVNGEERIISESTFKRWWKLVEETTTEDVKESVETFEKVVKPDTIDELKEINTEDEDIKPKEIEQFKEDAQEVEEVETTDTTKQPIEEVTETKEKETTKSSTANKKSPKDDEGVADFFQKMIYEKEGSFAIYSEPAKRVVKNRSGKTVMFYMIKRNCGIKLYLPEQLDEVIANGVTVEEKHTYPKQYPYRLEVTTLNDDTKDLLNNILQLYI